MCLWVTLQDVVWWVKPRRSLCLRSQPPDKPWTYNSCVTCVTLLAFPEPQPPHRQSESAGLGGGASQRSPDCLYRHDPENFSNRQILGSHHKPTEPDILGQESGKWHFSKSSSGFWGILTYKTNWTNEPWKHYAKRKKTHTHKSM